MQSLWVERRRSHLNETPRNSRADYLPDLVQKGGHTRGDNKLQLYPTHSSRSTQAMCRKALWWMAGVGFVGY